MPAKTVNRKLRFVQCASRFEQESAMRFLLAVLLSVALGVASAQATQNDEITPDIVEIKVPHAGSLGGDVGMVTEVFKPEGTGPFPVVLYSHGRAGTDVERRQMKTPVLRGHVRYWLRKGFAVVAPIRPGYGATGGPDRELSGARYDKFGKCTGRPDFAQAARNAAAASTAALDWIRAQSWAKADRM